MSEWVYPVAVIALTFAVVIPALTGLAVLALRRVRARSERWAEFGGNFSLMCIAAPSAVPLLALSTSAVQALIAEETGVFARADGAICVLDHVESCLDSLFLVAALGAIFFAVVGRHLWPVIRPAARRRFGRALPPEHPANLRLQAVVAACPALAKLRVSARSGAAAPAATVGLLRPRVILDYCFVTSADTEALSAALLHEAQHAARRDPLRVLFTEMCLSLNPTAAPLRRALSQWAQAREADCDAEAIRTGGEPLALASALVQAARFRGHAGCCGAHLTGPRGSELELRLTHLMVERHDALPGTSVDKPPLGRAWPWLLAVCGLSIVAPALVDMGLIATIHRLSEYLWLGWILS